MPLYNVIFFLFYGSAHMLSQFWQFCVCFLDLITRKILFVHALSNDPIFLLLMCAKFMWCSIIEILRNNFFKYNFGKFVDNIITKYFTVSIFLICFYFLMYTVG